MTAEPAAFAFATAPGIGRRTLLTAGAGGILAVASFTEPATAAGAAVKASWRFCLKCRGLFAGQGARSVGVCPAGGTHQPRKDLTYVLLSGLSVTDPHLFKNWFQCKKCRGLFANDRGDTGVCPKGGAHAGTGPDYDLWTGTSLPFMDGAWDECGKCSGLYNFAGGAAGVCPAGGGHERLGGGATTYTLIVLV